MHFVLQLGVILGVSCAGELLRHVIPLPVPASVYGLCILLLLLVLGVVKADSIRPTASFLIEVMPIMFVPAAVGLMESWGILQPALVPFLLTATLITAVVMAVTALIVQKMEGGKKQ